MITLFDTCSITDLTTNRCRIGVEGITESHQLLRTSTPNGFSNIHSHIISRKVLSSVLHFQLRLSLVSFIFCSFIRSAVISVNNLLLSARIVSLPIQFHIGRFCVAQMLERLSSNWKIRGLIFNHYMLKCPWKRFCGSNCPQNAHLLCREKKH